MASAFEKTAYTAELSAWLAARNALAALAATPEPGGCGGGDGGRGGSGGRGGRGGDVAAAAVVRPPPLLRWPQDLPRLTAGSALRPPSVQCVSLH
eukprot:248587-Chlamydomonas_euryale.AAC.1